MVTGHDDRGTVGAHERGAPTRAGGNVLIKHLAALAWATKTTQAVRST